MSRWGTGPLTGVSGIRRLALSGGEVAARGSSVTEGLKVKREQKHNQGTACRPVPCLVITLAIHSSLSQRKISLIKPPVHTCSYLPCRNISATLGALPGQAWE